MNQPDTTRKNKMSGWIVFFACLLLLSFGATPYHKIADKALIATRLTIILVLSILVVREHWSHRGDLPGGRSGARDKGESVLQRARRWYYGEADRNQQVK